MQSARSRACPVSTDRVGLPMRRAAVKPQGQAAIGLVSPLTGPLPLQGGPSQLVGVEEGVALVAVQQVWEHRMHTRTLCMLHGACVPCQCICAAVMV